MGSRNDGRNSLDWGKWQYITLENDMNGFRGEASIELGDFVYIITAEEISVWIDQWPVKWDENITPDPKVCIREEEVTEERPLALIFGEFIDTIETIAMELVL